MKGAAVRSTALRLAGLAGLFGMLALAGAGASVEIGTGAQAPLAIAQYCTPQDETPDAHRFYCHHEAGRSGVDAPLAA
jgi:hypothetical protein